MHLHVFRLDLIGYHVWRQTQTQTVINNFYKEDNNILHPRINDRADTNRIFKMEFPVMQWLFALFYKIFGNYIIISRILTFLIGIGSVFGMFFLCNAIFKNRILAVIAAWTFNFSPVFYYYTVNPLPDNFALFCGIWSGVFLFQYKNNERIVYILLSALLLGLATLTKLPFVLYSVAFFVFGIILLKNDSNKYKQVLLVYSLYLVTLLPAFIWYIQVVPGWGGNGIVRGILGNKETFATLFDILQFTVVSTLPELLINYGSVLFFIAGGYFLLKRKAFNNSYFPIFLLWGCAIVFYFLFEMNMIGKVHDYYLFPFLPLIFILVAYGCYHLLRGKQRFLQYLSFFALLLLPVTAFLRADARWNTEDPGFNATYYKYKDQLRLLTPQNAYCIVGNDDSHYILLYYIDRKGWAFDNNGLNEERLSYYISKGACYLFTDSPIDNDPSIKKHLGDKIFDKETLRVYKLQADLK
ncbi:MAG: glycosyltransferase family 39 protein [Taibaiella sp.]|nr:glycosyltransferase family 39 protein [Taibaiella sp.]